MGCGGCEISDNITFQTSVTATPPNATTVATDQISSAHHQLVKVEFGDNGTAYSVSAGTPLPVILYGTTSGSVFGLGTFQILGTVQLHGTSQVLGSVQPLAGSVHPASIFFGSVQGWQAHDGAAAGNPLLIGAFGSSGTQDAVGNGDAVRLWADLNGRLQVRGTIDSIPAITVGAALPAGDNNIGNVDVVTMPTVTVTATNLSVLGTVQTHGTSQVLGTVQTHGTSQIIGTVQTHGTSQVLGSVQGVGTFQVLGSVQTVGTSQALGTVQTHGTSQILGTTQPLAGSVHLATNLAGGTVVSVGSAVHGAVADTRPHLIGGFGSSGTQAAVDDGDATRLWTDLNGRLQIIGTIQSMPAIAIGTISGGTIQAFGTTEILGTVRALTTVNVTLGTIAEGTVYAFGSVAHGAVVAGNPLLIGVFGSSGTQAAVDDGDAVRLWADLNGRLQIRGTIDSMPVISGTVQTHGTSQVIGTVQPLAGSVHLATSLPGGTIVSVGSAVHGAVADTRPHLISAFGSSGTQAAVDDGDAVRLWADLNGRLQVRGTIDSIPSITIGAALPAGDNNIGNVDIVTMPTVTVTGTVQTHGTSQVLGTVQTVAGMLFGSVQGWQAHDGAVAGNPLLMGAFGSSGTQAAIADGDAVRLWADLNGRLQVRGTIDSIPSITIGAAIPAGNNNIGDVDVINVPTVQGSVAHDAPAGGNPVLNGGWATRARPGTVAVDDAARFWTDQHGRQVVQVGAGTTEPHGTTFTGAGANGTILAARGAGSFWRIFDMTLSGSGGGTFAIMQDTTVIWGPLFIANNGGWSFNSAVGVRLATANSSLNARFTAGTWSLFMNYGVEGA